MTTMAFFKVMDDRNKTLRQIPESSNIVLLHTDIRDTTGANHVSNTALALDNFEHAVTIVSCGEKICPYGCVQNVQIGGWIPKSIFGFLKSPLNLIRAIYASIWLLMNENLLDPSIILLHDTNYIICFLGTSKNLQICPVLNICNEVSTLSPIADIKNRISRINRYFLHYSAGIIVPSDLSAQILEDNRLGFCDKNMWILRPCVDTSLFAQQPILEIPHMFSKVAKDSIVFVVMGKFTEEYNFLLALKAHMYVLHRAKLKNEVLFKRLFLIIAGNLNTASGQQMRYFKGLQSFAGEAERPSVIIMTELSVKHKKILLANCTAVLLPSKKIHHDVSLILQSFYMGAVVIAVSSAISEELIEHKINGYLSRPTTKQFAYYMQLVIYDSSNYKYITTLIRNKFTTGYDKAKHSSDILKIISDVRDGNKANLAQNRKNELDLEPSRLKIIDVEDEMDDDEDWQYLMDNDEINTILVMLRTLNEDIKDQGLMESEVFSPDDEFELLTDFTNLELPMLTESAEPKTEKTSKESFRKLFPADNDYNDFDYRSLHDD